MRGAKLIEARDPNIFDEMRNAAFLEELFRKAQQFCKGQFGNEIFGFF